MGMELEWKLRVPAPEVLDEILAWERLQPMMAEAPRQLQMRSSYYDTPDRRLSAARITLRRRMENDRAVICVKTPLPEREGAFCRGEWELDGDDVAAALPRLVALGAPAALLEAGDPVCLWRAEFLRRAVLLRFPDGSAAELALDLGSLRGPTETAPLCELELELKAGEPAAAQSLLALLVARFGLAPEPKSKLARAKNLR